MDCVSNIESDTSSLHEDFIEMDAGEYAVGMSDEEVQSELKTLHKSEVRPHHRHTKNVKQQKLSFVPLSTPKIPSVVVIPERTLIKANSQLVSSAYPQNDAARKPPELTKTKTEPIASKQVRNRKASVKNGEGKSDGHLMALFAKVTASGDKESRRQVDMQMGSNDTSTPTITKRNRSAGTTPEGYMKQPEKLAKLRDSESRKTAEASNRNLRELITPDLNLNLKACLSDRPPTRNELQAIRNFLQYQIEGSLVDKEKFIPIFKEPCKLEQDGVYVYCSDQACARWVKGIIGIGIPEVSGRLTVISQETQLTFEPESVSVRVVTCIPTRKSKSTILDNLAQLNKDLNTERWRITNIRPKGSKCCTVYMRIDKPSFDKISAQSNRVNWILGPIEIEKEVHKQRAKKTKSGSKTEEHKSAIESGLPNCQFEPPSHRSVDGAPRSNTLTSNEEHMPIGSTGHVGLNDGSPSSSHTPTSKDKLE